MPRFRFKISDFRYSILHNSPAQRGQYSRLLRPLRGLKNLKQTGGFTLIELLVVLAVIGILATVVLASYNNFGKNQQVKNAAAELKSNLRKYQTLAISGQKNPTPDNPTPNCNDTSRILKSYEFDLDTASTPDRYRAILKCEDSSPPPTEYQDELPYHNLPNDVTVSPSCVMIIKFKPINEGIDIDCGGVPANPVYLELTNSAATVTYRVYVTNSGEIYDHRQ